jgi:hypothetical protein
VAPVISRTFLSTSPQRGSPPRPKKARHEQHEHKSRDMAEAAARTAVLSKRKIGSYKLHVRQLAEGQKAVGSEGTDAPSKYSRVLLELHHVGLMVVGVVLAYFMCRLIPSELYYFLP